ncbi:NAD(P)H-hydrate dehydratase [Candidatus Sororendozoicomonas aggregata]|uniref:NAD(P)H-hydrate dehydratase n=1 Tax=Candidatus Sororendozoicomonas aggregata TaxID=3073239 RepID=UPI002ED31AFA
MHDNITEITELLFTANQVREFDRIAIEDKGIDGFELMGKAATATFEFLCAQWPKVLTGELTLQIFCGAGNNGGDGYLIAALAKQKAIPVSVVYLKPPEHLAGDAKKAWKYCQKQGVTITAFNGFDLVNADIVIDAMLGTGLRGVVHGNYRDAIETINASGKPVLAVDIPSGLCADTGTVLGSAIKASATVTFIAKKQGLFTAMGPDCCGEPHFAQLDVPGDVYKKQTPACYQLSETTFKGLIHKRPACSHKGLYGSVLLVGGNYGMPGAIIIAAEAALASGAGRVSVATRAEHLSALAIRCPEVMAFNARTPADVKALITGKTALLVGPGFGQDDWSRALLKAALTARCPVILDADALNLVAQTPSLLNQRKYPTVMSPHPAEAGRLLNTTAAMIQSNRFKNVMLLHNQYNATVVLKGVGSLIGSTEGIALCSAGNPGMAVAGMGDLLSGVIVTLLGQGIPADKAASLGVWLHATAGDDYVAAHGEIGVLATSLIPCLRDRLNGLVCCR